MAVERRRMMTPDEVAVDRKIDAAAWGVFFVWVGIALFADVGWGVGLLGVGLIMLGAQAWRRYRNLRVELFSIIAGALFAIIGIWNLFEVRADIVPLLFVAVGIALIASALRGRRVSGARTGVDEPAHTRA